MSLASLPQNPLGHTGINFLQNPPLIPFNRVPQVTDVYPAWTTVLQLNVNPNRIWYTVGSGLWYLLPTDASSGVLGVTGDTGGEIFPSAGNLNLVGGAGVSVSGASHTLTVNVFDSVEGTATTTGAVTADVLTLPLGATPTSFSLDSFIAGFDSVTPAGVAYAATAGARTTGSTAALISTPQIDEFEDAALSGASISFVASANNLIVRVLGVAGKTIHWKARLSYLSV